MSMLFNIGILLAGILLIFLAYKICNIIFRWAMKVRWFWKQGRKKAAIRQLSKGVLLVVIVGVIAYLLKYIAIVVIAIVMLYLWATSKETIVYNYYDS